MDEHIPFGVKVRRLLNPAQPLDFGQDDSQQAGLGQELKTTPGSALGENLDDLIADTFPGDCGDCRRELSDGGEGLGSDGKSQPGGEPDRAEQAQAILVETGERIANRPDHPLGHVVLAAHIVEHPLRGGVIEHAVDGEVASQGVFPRVGKSDTGRVAAVDIAAVGAKGRHLAHMLSARYQDNPELHPNRDGV